MLFRKKLFIAIYAMCALHQISCMEMESDDSNVDIDLSELDYDMSEDLSDIDFEELMNPDKAKNDRLRAWNNEVILECDNPLFKQDPDIKNQLEGEDYFFGYDLKKIGFLKGDAIKLGLVGGKWIAYWLDYKRMEQLFIDDMFETLILEKKSVVFDDDEVIENSLKEKSPPPGVRSNVKKYLNNHMVTRSKDLLSPQMFTAITSSLFYQFVLKQIKNYTIAPEESWIDMFKNQFYFVGKREFEANRAFEEQYGLEPGSLGGGRPDHDIPPAKPLSVYHLLSKLIGSEDFITSIILRDRKAGLPQLISNFFHSLDDFSVLGISPFKIFPSFYKYKPVQVMQDMTYLTLFVCWYNINIQKPLLKKYQSENQEKIDEFKRLYKRAKNSSPNSQKKSADESDLSPAKNEVELIIKDHFKKSCSLSFITWLKLRNKKIARWRLVTECIVSIPGWFRVIKNGYDLYSQLTQTQEA